MKNANETVEVAGREPSITRALCARDRFGAVTDTSSSRFSAAGPALGYLAQVDYALLAALERMDSEDDFALSLETLDDIVFHNAETDDPTEKLQSKHTIDSSRTLSDASPDLWKTLHNWLVEPSSSNARLVLLAVADAGTAAARLRVRDGRDVAADPGGIRRSDRQRVPANRQPRAREFQSDLFLFAADCERPRRRAERVGEAL